MLLHLSINVIAALLLAFFTTASCLGSEFRSAKSYWEKLLHFDDVRSRVVSSEFFLSVRGQYDALNEKNETIRLLNSHNGHDVACNFPARYTWLRSQKFDVPNFDLGNCDELQQFLRSFQNETLGIVFVSEFIDSPASAFGHILLIFRNENTPLTLADAIHFSAQAESEGFFQYAYSGLNGKYAGFFMRDPLFQKLNEYTVQQQRTMYFYQLDFSSEEIARIVLHLYELRKARFHYYFTKENCAFHISELLDISTPDDNQNRKYDTFVLPIDIVKRYAHRFVARWSVPPSSLHLDNLLTKLTTDEVQIVKGVIAQRIDPSDSMSDYVKEVLSLHYQYSFRRKRVVYPNYDKVQSLQYTPQYTPTSTDMTLDDPTTNFETNLTMLGAYTSTARTGILLGYRPMLRDQYTPRSTAHQETVLSLLDIKVLAQSNGLRIDTLDLVEIRSIPNHTALQQPLSWSIYSGFNRENITDDLRAEFELGVGNNFGTRRAVFDVAMSVGLQKINGVDIYVKPGFLLMGYFFEKNKFGMQITNKQFYKHQFRQCEFFLSVPLKHGFLSVQYTNFSNGSEKMITSINLPF